jgi:acetyl esterase/lipase
MPLGYLVSVLFLGWCTLCALGPRRMPGTTGFRFGFIINEVPSLAVYWLVASTALAFAQGDLETVVGGIALGLCVVTVAGLITVAGRATSAGAAVERALEQGLGADWRTEAGSRATRFSVGLALFRPAFARRRNVERLADIAYGDAGRGNLLDVYRHRTRPEGCPVLVHLHGGRMAHGRKNREGLPLIYRLASHGWLCVSANYRLIPDGTFPDQLIDVKKVLAWVRSEGVLYGADPDVVFVAGGSSGGQLASLAALTQNDKRYQPGFETADTSVTGAVSMYGYYGDHMGEEASAPARVHPDAPPFFVAHGDQDTVIPVDGARRFAEALRDVSRAPVVYAEFPGAQHTFDLFHSVRCDNVVKAIESFTTWVRSAG